MVSKCKYQIASVKIQRNLNTAYLAEILQIAMFLELCVKKVRLQSDVDVDEK